MKTFGTWASTTLALGAAALLGLSACTRDQRGSMGEKADTELPTVMMPHASEMGYDLGSQRENVAGRDAEQSARVDFMVTVQEKIRDADQIVVALKAPASRETATEASNKAALIEEIQKTKSEARAAYQQAETSTDFDWAQKRQQQAMEALEALDDACTEAEKRLASG